MPQDKVLILCYWSSQEVLTASTALPHARELGRLKGNTNVVFVTLETCHTSSVLVKEEFVHLTVYVKDLKLNLLTKAYSFVSVPAALKNIIYEQRVTCILAIGTLAGSLAYLMHKRSHLPFYVSFYEPHSDYMRDSKVWGKFDPRYLYQKRWEWLQAKYASGLILVSENYKKRLLKAKLLADSKTYVVRNTADTHLFSFSPSDRSTIRSKLNIPATSRVGIYVGKYGDLYYKEEAFKIYKQCFGIIEDFRLIILSPQPYHEIEQQLLLQDIDPRRAQIAVALHDEVPAYLSAADFAFATIKSYPSARFCSPVKIGEYWANGLPVLLTEGIGDDSDIIKREGGGALFNLEQEGSVEQAIRQILEITKDPKHRQEIPKLAHKYRSPEKLREAYEYFFKASGGEASI